jgi:Prp8 binding protein
MLLDVAATIPSKSTCWGLQVTAGSGDKMVYVWDVASRHLLYKLPGHTGSVNETVFHPNEPIIGSAASDKNIYLGELTQ